MRDAMGQNLFLSRIFKEMYFHESLSTPPLALYVLKITNTKKK